MIKYVFIQNEPFLLPKVLDKYLREFHDTTAGINIQSVAQGKRTVFQTAMDLKGSTASATSSGSPGSTAQEGAGEDRERLARFHAQVPFGRGRRAKYGVG